VQFFNHQTGINFTPIFDQYLNHTAIPTLELKFESSGTVSYRWKTDEPGFQMPVRVGKKGEWQVLHATSDWQKMQTTLKKDEFDVATDLYYVNVTRQ